MGDSDGRRGARGVGGQVAPQESDPQQRVRPPLSSCVPLRRTWAGPGLPRTVCRLRPINGQQPLLQYSSYHERCRSALISQCKLTRAAPGAQVPVGRGEAPLGALLVSGTTCPGTVLRVCYGVSGTVLGICYGMSGTTPLSGTAVHIRCARGCPVLSDACGTGCPVLREGMLLPGWQVSRHQRVWLVSHRSLPFCPDPSVGLLHLPARFLSLCFLLSPLSSLLPSYLPLSLPRRDRSYSMLRLFAPAPRHAHASSHRHLFAPLHPCTS